MPPPRLVQIGVIGAAHGVRGEVRVKSFTAEPGALARHQPLTGPGGAPAFTVAALRPLKDDMVVVRFRGIDSRDAAEALNGLGLFVPRDALPPTDEDEFYHADLIGLRVETADGTVLGEVIAAPSFGADDLLEVRLTGPRRRAVFLPFSKAVVPVVDVAGGRVVVDPPDGWLDEPSPADPRERR